MPYPSLYRVESTTDFSKGTQAYTFQLLVHYHECSWIIMEVTDRISLGNDFALLEISNFCKTFYGYYPMNVEIMIFVG